MLRFEGTGRCQHGVVYMPAPLLASLMRSQPCTKILPMLALFVDQVTALLDEGAKYKPLDTLNVDLPDLDPF